MHLMHYKHHHVVGGGTWWCSQTDMQMWIDAHTYTHTHKYPGHDPSTCAHLLALEEQQPRVSRRCQQAMPAREQRQVCELLSGGLGGWDCGGGGGQRARGRAGRLLVEAHACVRVYRMCVCELLCGSLGGWGSGGGGSYSAREQMNKPAVCSYTRVCACDCVCATVCVCVCAHVCLPGRACVSDCSSAAHSFRYVHACMVHIHMPHPPVA